MALPLAGTAVPRVCRRPFPRAAAEAEGRRKEAAGQRNGRRRWAGTDGGNARKNADARRPDGKKDSGGRPAAAGMCVETGGVLLNFSGRIQEMASRRQARGRGGGFAGKDGGSGRGGKDAGKSMPGNDAAQAGLPGG